MSSVFLVAKIEFCKLYCIVHSKNSINYQQILKKDSFKGYNVYVSYQRYLIKHNLENYRK